MQNSESIRKWSDLKGLAVVTTDAGQKVGTLEDFYFDPQTNGVRALLVKTGFFGHRALMANAINAIGTDAVTFGDESMLIEEKSDSQLPTLPLGHSLLAYRVLSEGGNVIGTIANILLDVSIPADLRVDAFELAGDLRDRLSGHHHTFSASRVTRYGRDVIVVPDVVAQALKNT
jgi:uncharacterized protein YrrD